MPIRKAQREYSDQHIFALLHPIVRAWFKKKFKTFTPPQKYAVVEIHEGKSVLISSPTGSGKTLSAFLAAINELFLLASQGKLEDRIYVLYVSPLKALNNDVQRNLQQPLDEIYALARRRGLELPPIRVGVRTGDTSTTERSKQAKTPPHIFITTPESLAINLVAPKFSLFLAQVKWIILDEVHALAENKRGVHLALSLERLQSRMARDPVRVGLSATIHPLEEAAKFLVGMKNGEPRDCLLVDVNYLKQTDLQVSSPVKDLVYAGPEQVSSSLYAMLDKLISKHKTTLIFTNTRSGTERVVHQLQQRFGKKYVGVVGVHHSSLSKEVRFEVEERLKKGELKVVVCSTSLELGIDIGDVDLVVLLGSPKSISRCLQRVGRSGHRLHETSIGRLIVLDRDDLVECAVLVSEAKHRHLDRLHLPRNCLDVLAQHLVGMSIERRWTVDEAMTLVRHAYPYREMPESDLDSVLRYLGGHHEELEDKKVYGKLWYDRQSKTFGRRGRMVRVIYYTNIGTIPDEVAVRVLSGSRYVGRVEEEFAEKLRMGDIFVLGGKTLEYLGAGRANSIHVRERPEARPTIPSWFSEQLPLHYDLATRIQEFRGRANELLASSGSPAKAAETLAKAMSLDEKAATALVAYVDEQRRWIGVPTDSELLVEEFASEEGLWTYAFHALVGRRANDALSRAFAHTVTKRKNVNVQVSVTDNGFLLKLGYARGGQPGRLVEADVRALFAMEGFEAAVTKALQNTELLRRRFRHVAARSFLILRNYMGHSMGADRQQMASNALYRVLRELDPDFPVLKETNREVLEDAMDLANAKDYLAKVNSGSVSLRFAAERPMPSPFAFHMVAAGASDVVLMEDRKALIRSMHERLLEFMAKDGTKKKNIEVKARAR